jgi:hypothetical protein
MERERWIMSYWYGTYRTSYNFSNFLRGLALRPVTFSVCKITTVISKFFEEFCMVKDAAIYNDSYNQRCGTVTIFYGSGSGSDL